MVSLYLFLAAVIVTDVFTFDDTCSERVCRGPKFGQSDCCQGFICVALYKPGAEDVLECVDEEEHFRVKSLEEILWEVDREFPESETNRHNHQENLLLDDQILASYVSKLRDLEEYVFYLEDFNNPTVLEYQSQNVTM